MARLPVQAALERSLAAQMRGAMAQPLQECFRASFQGTLVPAFESACQTMFSQVGPLISVDCWLIVKPRSRKQVIAVQAQGQLCCWT